jgi:2,3-dihydroxyphenylpropionate 1,2-dioxygenase
VTGARLCVCSSHAIPPPPGDPTWPYPTMPEVWHAWERARDAIDAFWPDVVVLFGIDHRRAFRSVIPSVAIALAATARGDRNGPVGRYAVPADLARELAGHVSAQDIDIAVAHDVALDHGFGHAARDLLGGIDR